MYTQSVQQILSKIADFRLENVSCITNIEPELCKVNSLRLAIELFRGEKSAMNRIGVGVARLRGVVRSGNGSLLEDVVFIRVDRRPSGLSNIYLFRFRRE